VARSEDCEVAHAGTTNVTNPEVGKPSTPKQILSDLTRKFVSVMLSLALFPTLMTTWEGLTVKLGSDCQSLEAEIVETVHGIIDVSNNKARIIRDRGISTNLSHSTRITLLIQMAPISADRFQLSLAY
jgi:hypothetical protein